MSTKKKPAGINRRLKPIVVTDAIKRRFWDGVAIGEPTECWPWKRCYRNGYGAAKVDGRVHSAHRVAFVLTNGEPEADKLITHTCDNRSCCNPAHLKAGTPEENNREARDRSRIDRPHGEQCYNAVLNEQLVTQIWLHRKEGLGARRISKLIPIKEKAISDVLVGRCWNHLRPSWADGGK